MGKLAAVAPSRPPALPCLRPSGVRPSFRPSAQPPSSVGGRAAAMGETGRAGQLGGWVRLRPWARAVSLSVPVVRFVSPRCAFCQCCRLPKCQLCVLSVPCCAFCQSFCAFCQSFLCVLSVDCVWCQCVVGFFSYLCI